MAVAYAAHTAVASSATSFSANNPAGAGVLLAHCVTRQTLGETTWTPPAGWTLVVQNTANAVQSAVFYRIADGTQPASQTWTRDNNAVAVTAVVVIARHTGARATDPIDVAGLVGGSGASLVLPSITAANANTFLWQSAVSQNAGATWTPPASATERYDVSTTGVARGVAGGDAVVGAGATGTRTWTPSASVNLGGAIVAVIPALPGSHGDTLQYSMNRLAGTLNGDVPTLDAQGAANEWAGTTGLSLVGALNVKATNVLPNYRELQGVLNQLAGTTGLGVDAAAAAITA